MITGSIAQRYAQAQFELSRESGAIDRDFQNLKTLDEVFRAEPETLAFLSSPTIERRVRIEAVKAIADRLKATEALTNFLCLLVERGRIDRFPGIFLAYEGLRNAAENRLNVEVKSPVALTAEQKKHLSDRLSARLGKTIQIAETVDPSLLGGLWIRVGSTVLDATLKAQIDRLQASPE